MPKKSAGFIQLIPLLIITFVAVSMLAVSMQLKSKNLTDKAVLSESDSGGEPNQTTSVSPSQEKVETPEPKETPEPEEIENEAEFEVHDGSEAAKVKIKLGKKEGKDVVAEQEFKAQSNFPLSVNKTTSQLTVTTPAGIKTVAILPDAAVQNMILQNVINSVLNTNGQNINIKIDENGNVVYEISGVKNERLLGLFNVTVPKTLDVSTQTGSLVKVNQSPLSQLLDLLSI